MIQLHFVCNNTPGRQQSKTLLTIDEHAQKLLETVFFIDICRQLGDKWQSKTLYLTFLIVLTFLIANSINVFDCRLPFNPLI